MVTIVWVNYNWLIIIRINFTCPDVLSLLIHWKNRVLLILNFLLANCVAWLITSGYCLTAPHHKLPVNCLSTGRLIDHRIIRLRSWKIKRNFKLEAICRALDEFRQHLTSVAIRPDNYQPISRQSLSETVWLLYSFSRLTATTSSLSYSYWVCSQENT